MITYLLHGHCVYFNKKKKRNSQITDKAKKIRIPRKRRNRLSSAHTSIFSLLTMKCTCFVSRFDKHGACTSMCPPSFTKEELGGNVHVFGHWLW